MRTHVDGVQLVVTAVEQDMAPTQSDSVSRLPLCGSSMLPCPGLKSAPVAEVRVLVVRSLAGADERQVSNTGFVSDVQVVSGRNGSVRDAVSIRTLSPAPPFTAPRTFNRE